MKYLICIFLPLFLASQATAFSNPSEEVFGVGITFGADQNSFVVRGLAPGGPADNDGTIKVGDTLLAVQPEPNDIWKLVANLHYKEVIMMLRGPEGTPVGLHLISNGQEYGVTLTRQKLGLLNSQ